VQLVNWYRYNPLAERENRDGKPGISKPMFQFFTGGRSGTDRTRIPRIAESQRRPGIADPDDSIIWQTVSGTGTGTINIDGV